jgi:hypothetical protein
MAYNMDPVEWEILIRINGRISVSQLFTILEDLKIGKASVLVAITSLLRKRIPYIE